MSEESDFTGFKKITIIGCGLIGGSIGLALKKNSYSGEIAGIDRKEVIEKAIYSDAIDWGTEEIEKGVKNADMVILATPVQEIIKLLSKIKPFLPKYCLVTDTGSTKKEIIKEARKVYADKYDFIGGHPMAGLEKGGIEYADPDLFSGKPYITVSGREIPNLTGLKMSAFLNLIHALEIRLNASEHDRIIALVSHVPQLIAVIMTNLFGSLVQEGYDEKCLKIGGNAFNEMTRIASSPFSMWKDIYQTNSKWTINYINDLEDMLDQAKEKIANSPDKLEEDFQKAGYYKEKMSQKTK